MDALAPEPDTKVNDRGGSRMNQQDLFKHYAVINILTAVLMLSWWLLMLVPLPAADTEDLLLEMVRHDAWTWVNVLGSLASLGFALVLVGFYQLYGDRLGRSGFYTFITTLCGWMLYVWIQVEETIIWPLMADHAPQLIDMQGPMFADPAFQATYILMALMFMPGILILGIKLYKLSIFPSWAMILFIVGTLLFAIGGTLFVVRTLGLILEVIGLITISLHMYKHDHELMEVEQQ